MMPTARISCKQPIPQALVMDKRSLGTRSPLWGLLAGFSLLLPFSIFSPLESDSNVASSDLCHLQLCGSVMETTLRRRLRVDLEING